MTKTMTAAATLLGMGAFAVLGTVFQPEPAPLAVTTTADSSIGLPIPAWISADGRLYVYVGSAEPNRRLLVNRSEALNFERAYWTRNVVDASGFARIPMPDTPRIQVREEQADGSFKDIVPPVWVKDLAHGR